MKTLPAGELLKLAIKEAGCDGLYSGSCVNEPCGCAADTLCNDLSLTECVLAIKVGDNYVPAERDA